MFQCHPKVCLDSIYEREYMMSMQIINFNIDNLKLINYRPVSGPGFHQKWVKRGDL